MQEDAHREGPRGRSRSSAGFFEGIEHFMGVRESAGGSVVHPVALRYTAERVHMEANVLKQQRFPRERRAWGLPTGGRDVAAF